MCEARKLPPVDDGSDYNDDDESTISIEAPKKRTKKSKQAAKPKKLQLV